MDTPLEIIPVILTLSVLAIHRHRNWHDHLQQLSYYRPQRSCGQGNVFTAVCDSVHRGDLWQGEFPLARRPHGQGEPPGRENPRARENPPGRVNPPGKETPQPGRPPGRENPLAGEPPQPGRTPPGQGDMVNEQPVHILLECILVFEEVLSYHASLLYFLR